MLYLQLQGKINFKNAFLTNNATSLENGIPLSRRWSVNLISISKPVNTCNAAAVFKIRNSKKITEYRKVTFSLASRGITITEALKRTLSKIWIKDERFQNLFICTVLDLVLLSTRHWLELIQGMNAHGG